jgi:hypothetical protein
VAPFGFEALDGLEQAEVPFLNQIDERDARVADPAGHCRDQTQVARDECVPRHVDPALDAFDLAQVHAYRTRIGLRGTAQQSRITRLDPTQRPPGSARLGVLLVRQHATSPRIGELLQQGRHLRLGHVQFDREPVFLLRLQQIRTAGDLRLSTR